MWKRIRNQWRVLSAGAIWIFGIIATFVIPPFFLEQSWIYFTRFVVAIITGLSFIATARWARKQHALGWAIVTLVLLIAGVGFYFTYDSLMRRWAVPYGRTRVLIGSTYSDFAQDYRQQFRNTNGRDLSDQELVWHNGGPDGLWRQDEIESRRIIATSLYIANVVLPACCIVALTQALACSRVLSSS
jgi:hypothetical protein